MNEKKNIIQLIKAHKSELIVCGVSVVALIGAFLLVKNHEALEEQCKELLDNILKLKKSPEDINDIISNGVNQAPKILIEGTADKMNLSPKFVAVEDEEPVSYITVNVEDYNIRTLPDGWKHSQKKQAEADELGICIALNQTIVDPYQYQRVSA